MNQQQINMNMNFIKKMAAVLIIAAVAFTEGKSTSMTMTTAMKGRVDILLAGTGEAVIDWGDGSAPEPVTLLAAVSDEYLTHFYRYAHEFLSTTVRTIIITGQNITHLYCYNNQLTSLDITKNTTLEMLACHENQLIALDVSKNTALKELHCSLNQLTSLDVTKNTTLTTLDCRQNKLMSLDVTKNKVLTTLECRQNKLMSLDVSKNTTLIYLDCSENQLTSLDVTKNTALIELWCVSNELTSLDVNKNTALTKMSVEDCDFTAAGLNTLFGTLHSNAGSKTIYITGNPGADDCNESIAKDKGWEVDSL